MHREIIGDIINSNEITNRSELQRKIKEILDDLDSKYDSKITSKFTITLSDEFQGSLINTSQLSSIFK